MNDGKRVVARLPTRITGPPRLTTNSEVATIKYLKSEAKIPTPTILDWSDDPSNTIGSEYIIMEHVMGVPLCDKWATMSGKQQLDFIVGILEIVEKMAAMEFPAYGSLYFANAPIESAFELPEVQDYVIGPHCGPRYWDCNPGEERYYSLRKPNRGPWPDLAAYCSGLIDTGFSRLPPVDAVANKRPSYHGSVAEHMSLLGSARDVISKLIEEHQIQVAAAPTLLHPGLSSRNIYVSNDDPTTITGIIDWQSSSIEPAFIYADDVPDFAVCVDYNSSEDHISPEEQRAREDATAKAERCNRLFDGTVKFRIPKLFAARTLDDDLRRIFDYCSRTWIDGAVVFRQVLIENSSRWKGLGLADSCPYSIPSPDALLAHQQDFQVFQTAQEFTQEVMHRLDIPSDGWVPADSWKEISEAHKNLFNGVLRMDQILTEQELREVWPFDSP